MCEPKRSMDGLERVRESHDRGDAKNLIARMAGSYGVFAERRRRSWLYRGVRANVRAQKKAGKSRPFSWCGTTWSYLPLLSFLTGLTFSTSVIGTLTSINVMPPNWSVLYSGSEHEVCRKIVCTKVVPS